MELPELPECPVCLQNYDGASTIPRVLGCGHTACEDCLTKLPHRYPETIRCPACTQLVKYPPNGAAALPKNIDLLSLSISLSPPQNPNPSPPKTRQQEKVCTFLPRLWSDEFYDTWKDWVVGNDAVLVETEESGKLCENGADVGLVKVGSFKDLGESEFELSYNVKVLKCLSEMREEERRELGLLVRGGVRQCRRVGRVYGVWGNVESGVLCLVCERGSGRVEEKLKDLRNGGGFGRDGLGGFGAVGMGMCEAVMGLHLVGIVGGGLRNECFGFNEVGCVFVDLREVVVMGRRVWGSVGGRKGKWEIGEEEMGEVFGGLLRDGDFVSMEVLFEVVKRDGVNVECERVKYPVGCGSDVWSLGCVLLSLLLGKEFSEEIGKMNYICDDSAYASWIERVSELLDSRLGSEYASLRETLFKCLNYDPASRPLVIEVMSCIRELIVKPQYDIMAGLERPVMKNSTNCCLILAELCQMPKKMSETEREHELQGKEFGEGADDDHVEERSENGFIDGLTEGKVKSNVLMGHRDSITGLAVGGEFLFSSSFDKTIHVWALQDFCHVHTFKGHEHTIKALLYADEETPLCISGDSGGGIFVWGTCSPLGQKPSQILYEQKDWRFSGIHALAFRNGYIYTGSGDRTVKAWSLQDGTISCTMSGHKSVVSTLAVCDTVLYSGSWDGTIRLWSLGDHSSLAVLGEDTSGTVASVLTLAAVRDVLIATHENGCVKVWINDVLMKSIEMHNGAVFATGLDGNWLFTGGMDKTVNVQEWSGDEFQTDFRPIGSIPCDSVITAMLCWQGKLFVGFTNRNIMVFYYDI
ncbi:uncharacterized protein LOC126784207 [Argentina anserina]|uniref:uncharacterized protein LOC126784207 n=1 Tax=Argentina anserina TaxID=57926 RepID=UPI00217689F9|nr:uncharacterized protein LOC126784207 [Potentilla anserina]